MDVSAISSSGGLASAMSRQTFGAAVVSKTLDYMNDAGGSSLAPVDKQTFGASVVSKTLDYMNTSPAKGSSQSYDFQTSVLGGAYGAKIVDAYI
ncbi:MAG: hypothetical protein JW718_00280 [Desulfovibrionaceae bacterium]|nr:hypothetical protein [Desulfovibrionaceae bacterium]